MYRLTSLVLLTTLATGCVGLPSQSDLSVQLLAGLRPHGQLQPAAIFEIDGEPVSPRKGRYRIKPGRHTVRVWPLSREPRRPYAPTIDGARGIDALELEWDARADSTYYFGAAERRFRTLTLSEQGDTLAATRWRRVIIPVIFNKREAAGADSVAWAESAAQRLSR